jgi:PAS domain S-box-containing protein
MELQDLLLDREFLNRKNPSTRDKRFEALQKLAGVFSEAPNSVLQKLVDIAVEFCGADSAGISLEEADRTGNLRFRWVVISGSFSQYVNGTTPRFFSPCGTCLSTGRPQHYRVSKPYYDFLGVTAEPITDGMLIPWTSDESRGTIWAISHRSREAFDLDDYKLLNTLADFAGISVRLSEREQRNTADLRALQRIQEVTTRLVGSHDLQARLAEILSAAADLIGTDKGNIQLYDPDSGLLRIVAHQGFGPRFLQRFLNQGSRFVCDLAAQKVQRMIWEEIAEEPALQGTEDLDVILGDGIRAIQSTPLISLDGRLLGLLNNHFRVPHRPSERELRYLDLLARMAADFIERWRVDDALRTSEERFRTLVSVITDVSWTRDPEGRFITDQPAWSSYTGQRWDEYRDFGWLNAIHADDRQRVQDLWKQSVKYHTLIKTQGRLWHAVTKQYRRVDVKVIPVLNNDGSIREWVGSHTDIEDQKQIEEVLQRSHNELESQVEQRTSSLRQLSAELLRVQDEERRKIARDLHDSIGQYLVALKMNLTQLQEQSGSSVAQTFEDSHQVIDQCLSETRTISHLLHPPLLDESGLRSAAQWYVEGYSKRSGIAVQLDVDDRLGRMSQKLETALFRVLQESLTNVHRHSGSDKVDISIRLEGRNAVVVIRDYGSGFAPQVLRDLQNGCAKSVGLTGMRERITTLGGVLEVTSADPGATISVKLPIADEKSRPAA